MDIYQRVKRKCDVPYSGKERRGVKVVYYEVVIAASIVSTTTESIDNDRAVAYHICMHKIIWNVSNTLTARISV